jgi:phosphoglycerol transferase MdoB-like AlkP superfamily enzyme
MGKRLKNLAPPKAILRYLLILWAAVGAVFVVDRVVIFFLSNTAVAADSWRDIVLAFGVGSVRDMALAALLVAPALLAFMLLRRLWRPRIGRIVAMLAATGIVGLALFGGVAEIFFWNEFDSRFNGVAVNYLMFPREVIGNIHQSFDTSLYLPMIAVAALVIMLAMRRPLAASIDAAPAATWRSALAAFIVLVAAGGGVVALLPGSVSADREVNQIGASGVATFVDAAINNNTDYDGVYPGMPEDEAIRLVRDFYSRDTLLDPPGTRSIRRFVDNGPAPKKLNIVIVIEESFGSVFVDGLDNRRDERISPNIDRLAADGLFFTNIYASGDRTVRGLEAVLTSFQPIPGISTARRPGSQGMVSLPTLLNGLGYQTAMLYAGLDSFDNMGNFWRGIGFDHVWDQTDIEDAGFTTIWGVADEYLFGDALKKLDRLTAAGKPAMLTMLTVSNHRPYTYPTGRIDKDPEAKRIENTATYADWAFGDFIERARMRPWFDDTVFVFVGDHGWKVNGAAQVPLHSFRIPLLVYAPAHIAPRRIDTLGAQIDLAPTLLGLLGISYESRFFGKDLLRTQPGDERIAVAHNYSIAFARPGNAVVLEPDGTMKAYAFTPGQEELAPLPRPDEAVARLGVALTQTAHHMFYAGEMLAEPLAAPKTALALPAR